MTLFPDFDGPECPYDGALLVEVGRDPSEGTGHPMVYRCLCCKQFRGTEEDADRIGSQVAAAEAFMASPAMKKLAAAMDGYFAGIRRAIDADYERRRSA